MKSTKHEARSTKHEVGETLSFVLLTSNCFFYFI